MPDNWFLDTNILVYLYSTDEPSKRAQAMHWVQIRPGQPWVSTQVLTEIANVLRRKFALQYPAVIRVIAEIRSACAVYCVTPDTVVHALMLAERYGYAYFDSLILAAALEAGCQTLVSEDMHSGQQIESRLLILNPFR